MDPAKMSAISLIVSIVLGIDAIYLHYRQRKLIKFQKEYLERSLENDKKADFTAKIIKVDNKYFIRFTNCGKCIAKNVNINVDERNKLFYYFFYNNFNKQFPLNSISPNTDFNIPANILASTPIDEKKCVITWDDDFCKANKKELNLNL